jgi:surface antigen
MKEPCSLEGYAWPAPPRVDSWAYQNEFWRDGLWGQCTWYACGRAVEVFGVAPRFTTKPRDAGRWLEIAGNYEKLYGSIVSPSIAVFERAGTLGHVVFVESVEAGFVRFTEANYANYTGPDADRGGGWDGELHVIAEREFRLRGQGYSLRGCLRLPSSRGLLGPQPQSRFA